MIRVVVDAAGSASRCLRSDPRSAEDRELLAAEHGAEAPALPSERTIYRLVKRLSEGKHTFGSARTRRSLAKQPDAPFATITVARPGELTQIDSTPLDVRAVLDDGLVDRVELTGLVDQDTRTLCAVVARPSTKAVDASLCLARALTPEPMRPGWVDASPRVEPATNTRRERLLSMDDPAVFGPALYEYPFSRAIGEKFLKDYRILVVGIRDSDARRMATDTGAVWVDRVGAPSLRTVVAQAALAKAVREYGLRRTLVFTARVEAAAEFARSLHTVAKQVPGEQRPQGPLDGAGRRCRSLSVNRHYGRAKAYVVGGCETTPPSMAG